jgi:hypothetical protein
LSLLDSGRLERGIAQLLPGGFGGCGSSVLFAQNRGQSKLQDHASIPDAVTSTDFSLGNLCGKELRDPWLVRRTLFSGKFEEGIHLNYSGHKKKVGTIRVLDTSSFCRQLLLIKQVMSVAANLPLLP